MKKLEEFIIEVYLHSTCNNPDELAEICINRIIGSVELSILDLLRKEIFENYWENFVHLKKEKWYLVKVEVFQDNSDVDYDIYFEFNKIWAEV